MHANGKKAQKYERKVGTDGLGYTASAPNFTAEFYRTEAWLASWEQQQIFPPILQVTLKCCECPKSVSPYFSPETNLNQVKLQYLLIMIFFFNFENKKNTMIVLIQWQPQGAHPGSYWSYVLELRMKYILSVEACNLRVVCGLTRVLNTQ